MTQKPHRFVLDRVAGYAEEVAAFMRRRRHRSRPFARVAWPGGTLRALEADSDEGRALFTAAARVIAVSQPPDPDAEEGAETP